MAAVQGLQVRGEPSGNSVETLQQMFPQVENEVISTVLEQEGSVESAMDALLRSSGQDDMHAQLRQDEQLARTLQATASTSALTPDPWDNLKQAANELARTVSDGLTAISQNVSYWLQDDEVEVEVEAERSIEHEAGLKGIHRTESWRENKKDK